MDRFLAAVLVAISALPVVSCAEEPPPAHPEIPLSPEEVEAARARQVEEERQRQEDLAQAAEAEQRRRALFAGAEERHRAEKEKKAAEEAARVAEQQQQGTREAAARAVIDKLRPWAQAHVSWNFEFPASVKTTCANEVNVSVPCGSAAARTRYDEMTVNASATVRNNTNVPLRCQARFSFSDDRVFNANQPKAVKSGSARFGHTASFQLPVIFYKAKTNGECVIAIEDVAKIVEMPVEELKALFPYQPSAREHHGMSFMLGDDINGHVKPLEFFTVYLLPDDPTALFNARVRKY